MAYNLSIKQLALVDEYRQYLSNEPAKLALDELIARAKIESTFDFSHMGCCRCGVVMQNSFPWQTPT